MIITFLLLLFWPFWTLCKWIVIVVFFILAWNYFKFTSIEFWMFVRDEHRKIPKNRVIIDHFLYEFRKEMEKKTLINWFIQSLSYFEPIFCMPEYHLHCLFEFLGKEPGNMIISFWAIDYFCYLPKFHLFFPSSIQPVCLSFDRLCDINIVIWHIFFNLTEIDTWYRFLLNKKWNSHWNVRLNIYF